MEGFGSSNAFPQTPSAPPPPPEVKVRTMRSDLEAMAKSGGGLPHFESMKVAGLAVGNGNQDPAVPMMPTPGNPIPEGNKMGVIALIVIAALGAFALIGYLIYRILQK